MKLPALTFVFLLGASALAQQPTEAPPPATKRTVTKELPPVKVEVDKAAAVQPTVEVVPATRPHTQTTEVRAHGVAAPKWVERLGAGGGLKQVLSDGRGFLYVDGSLRLAGGPLESVVEGLEEWATLMKQRDGTVEMPNIVFGPGTAAAKVETNMVLRQVTPVQALALVATAAGCTLEWIYAPAEEGAGAGGVGEAKGPQPIIGYRFVLATENPPPATGRAGGVYSAWIDQLLRAHNSPAKLAPEDRGLVGIVLGEKDGGPIVERVQPELPADKSKQVHAGDRILAVKPDGEAEVDVTGLPTQEVATLIQGKPGSGVVLKLAGPDSQPREVTLTRERHDLPPAKTYSEVKVVTPGGAMTLPPPAPPAGGGLNFTLPPRNIVGLSGHPAPNPLPAPSLSNTPVVRVYALGAILSGVESYRQKQQEELQKLVAVALEHADLRSESSPLLSFHPASRALIAKATSEQHEIIQQIITAMKENAAQTL